MANAAAIMPTMLKATATNACSIASVPPSRATMSRTVALLPISSPMPLTTLPISRPYATSPTVHSTRAPRLSRHANPVGPCSAGSCARRAWTFGDQPGTDVASGQQLVGDPDQHHRGRDGQQQHPEAVTRIRPDLQRPAERGEPRERAGLGARVADGTQRECRREHAECGAAGEPGAR